MATKTDRSRAGACIVSESPGHFSREEVTIISGQVLSANTVLGKITASGKYMVITPGASDGSQTAAAVLFDDVDATGADKKAVVLLRDCEVNASELTFGAANAGQITTAKGQLTAAGIVVREGV